MPGLLNEISLVSTLISGAGMVADTTGKRYNGYAVADSTNHPIDTRYYDQAYIHVSTGNYVKSQFTAAVVLSPSTSPTDTGAVTIGSFGSLDNTSSYTGFVLSRGYPRYMWLLTDGTTAAGQKAEIQAEVTLYNHDRPTDQTATDTFAVIA